MLSLFPAPGVTFESSSKRLELLLPELSKAVGTPLSAAAALRDQRLIVAWHDKPSGELLKDVARVCAAEWEPAGAGLRLVRPLEIERALAKAAIAMRIAEVRRDLAKREPLPPFDAKAITAEVDAWYRGGANERNLDNDAGWKRGEAMDAIFSKGPAGRLADRVARLLPPESYADLVGDERRVFSTKPSGSQAALGPGFDTLVADFCRENAAMVAAAGARPKVPSMWAGDPTRQIQAWTPAQVRVEVEAITYWGMRPFQLMVTVKGPPDPNRYFLAAHTEVVGGEEPATATPDDPTPYEASPLPTVPKAAWTERLRRPDLHEPLADALGELARLAALRREDLVARVDDTAGLVSYRLRLPQERRTTVGKAFKLLLHDAHTFAEEGGVVLIAPVDEPEYVRDGCDRRDLAALYAAAKGEGFASIDAASAFAQRNGKRAFEGLGRMFVEWACPGAGQGFEGMDVEALRLYGALSPEQRKAALAGGRVPIGDLGPAARAQAERLVLGLRNRSTPDDEGFLTDQANREATARMRGLGNETYVTGGEARSPIAFAIHPSKDGLNHNEVLSPGSLAERAGMAEERGGRVDLDAWLPNVVAGERRTVTLRVVPQEGKPETLTLREDRFPAGAAPKPYAELPASFRNAVERAREARRQAMEGFGRNAERAKP